MGDHHGKAGRNQHADLNHAGLAETESELRLLVSQAHPVECDPADNMKQEGAEVAISSPVLLAHDGAGV